jgi:hypothetical protein
MPPLLSISIVHSHRVTARRCAALQIIDRWIAELDDGKGVIPGPQPNTYDCALYGVNAFVGSLYLCALRAGEEMATLQGDAASAAKYRAQFELGTVTLDTMCFTNGKWYTQVGREGSRLVPLPCRQTSCGGASSVAVSSVAVRVSGVWRAVSMAVTRLSRAGRGPRTPCE